MQRRKPNLSAVIPYSKNDSKKYHYRSLQHSRLQEDLRFDEVKLSVTLIKDLKKGGLGGMIGGYLTHIAFKSHKSYLVGTYEKGLNLVDNGTLVYSRKLSVGDSSLFDLIYIPCLNCYFLATMEKLYRKDIDDKPPYLYMGVECGLRFGACFRYSNLQEKLYIKKDEKIILVVNPKTKKVEIKAKKTVGGDIVAYRVFGEMDNRIVSTTEDGLVVLYNLNYREKRGSMIAQYKLKLIKETKEEPQSLAVCPKNEYILLEIGQNINSSVCSRMIVFKIIADTLVISTVVDQHDVQIGYKYALECFGYVDGHILWIGLPWNKNAPVQVYEYDTESGDFAEMEDLRVKHQEYFPYRLHRLEDIFYYTGNDGQLMRLSLANMVN